MITDILVAHRPGRDLMLDLVHPRTGTGPWPVVAWVHGGAWLRGNRKRLPERLAPLTGRGIAVASVEYRLSAEATFPAQLLDVRAALRHLHEHAAELDLDPSALGLWGASAGGHLVALAGLLAHHGVLPGEPDGPAVAVHAVAAAYAPSDLTTDAPPPESEIPALAGTDPPDTRLLGGPAAARPAVAREASPLHRVTAAAPPFQLCHGTADRLVEHRHSVRLHERLLAAGVDSELYLIPSFGHAFVNPAGDGDVDAANLLDAGRLAAEEPVDAIRYGREDPASATFGFDTIAAFLAKHLLRPAVGAA